MSRPEPGTYVIYNRVLSPAGEKLAVTFKDGSKPNEGIAILTPLKSGDDKQKWTIANFNTKTQSISPYGKSNLQAAQSGQPNVLFIPASTLVWTIRSSDKGYSIKTGDESVTWEVLDSNKDANVKLGWDTGLAQQRWIFEKV